MIVNERSSRTRKHLGELPGLLAARDIEVAGAYVVPPEKSLSKRPKAIVKDDATLAIVGGGDGAMTTACDVLAHEECALGLVPLGTGNSFALTLGIPDDVAGALDVIAVNRIVSVDLGTVNGTHFANFATIGLSAEIADRAPHDLKAKIGRAAYAIGGVRSFFSHEPFRSKIRWDNGKTELRTQQIVVANGRYFGNKPVSADASIVDRKLAFFTTTGVSHLEVARMYLAFVFGVQTKLPDAIAFSSREIVVKASPKQLVSIDGNTLGKTPARFGVAPRALRGCVPLEFDDESR
ncbi:MAG: lipid kinase [Vulcanimicrobiaceae bacterium]